MDLAKILDSLSTDGHTKTAENSTTGSRSETALSAALRRAVSQVEPPRGKTASAASPAADLTKIANRLASAEQEALVKEAQLYGAAVCDGFMARMGTYEGVQSTKTAAYGGNFEKFAAENPDLVKQAAELGYRETREKIAAATQGAYQQGYNQTREKIAAASQGAYQQGYTKVASMVKEAAEHCAVRGYNDTLTVLSSMQR